MALTHRERLLASLSCCETDYVPCSFMIFFALRRQCRDHFEFVDRQLALGLDARVDISDLRVRFHPEVTVREGKTNEAGQRYPLLHKEYHTPAGVLRTTIRQDEDWPYGDHVPLFDDYLATRSAKFLITGPEDLPALRYLLTEPDKEILADYRTRAKQAGTFAERRQLLLCGGGCNFERTDVAELGHDLACVGIDALMWLCGAEAPLIWAYEQPGFLQELISTIAEWNRKRMEIALSAGIDLIIKRAWYEGTDFWSPNLYRKYIVPVLAEDIRLAHQAGVKFGYILTSGMIPLLEDILALGPDVIIGIDPVQGVGTELAAVQRGVHGRCCLWGGVNGCLTMEQGSPQEVRRAVEEAVHILGKNRGFILSPTDNVREWNPAIEKNVNVFLDTWKALRHR